MKTNLSELERLLPCPFCGESHSIVCETAYGDGQAYAVSCRTRDCHGAIFALALGLFKTPAEAIAAWNTRAESPTLSTLSARVEELEGSLRSVLAYHNPDESNADLALARSLLPPVPEMK